MLGEHSSLRVKYVSFQGRYNERNPAVHCLSYFKLEMTNHKGIYTA